MEIQLLDLYRDFLLPLTPSKAVSDVLSVVMTGGETTQDLADTAARDPEFREWLEIAARRIGKSSRATSLEYKVSILGVNRVRNLLVGRHLERAIVPPEKTLLALMQQEREKNKSPQKPKTQAPAQAGNEAPPKEDEEDEALKSIPDFLSFEKYLPYSLRAEAVAVELKYSFPGQGYAAGVLFDYARAFLATREIEPHVQEQRFKRPEKFVDELFEDGLRCAVAADEITKHIQILYQKNVFFSAIVRNIGKTILLAYDPAGYERSVFSFREALKSGIPMKNSEAEEDEFDLDHAQITALYIGRVPAFQGLEKSIDYHHDPRLLKSRDREQHALSCVLRLAGMLVTAYQKNRTKEANIGRLRDRKITESEVFKVLRLTEQEWDKIKDHYAMNLMKIGL